VVLIITYMDIDDVRLSLD